MNKYISIIGGDLRQLTLASLFAKDGYKVYVYGFGNDYITDNYTLCDDFNTLEQSDVIIFPIPVSANKKHINAPFFKSPVPLSCITRFNKKGKLILGGKISDDIYSMLDIATVVDYAEREELMIKNAIATAEGAVEIAMAETPFTIYQSKCLVIGFGRIGKVLSKMLRDFGADVYVSARKQSDIAWIETNGYKSLCTNTLAEKISDFNIIFNTVPNMVLNESSLKEINPECIIIDLASKPGGVDFKTAGDLNLKVIWALGLPGKVAPVTSGKIIKETVQNIIRETEV